VTRCLCPLCGGNAEASDIDHNNRARIYCDSCTPFDITRTGHSKISGPDAALRAKDLARYAQSTPAGKILAITAEGAAYEERQSKPDRPAPDWLEAPSI
jgi:hypothetical protein